MAMVCVAMVVQEKGGLAKQQNTHNASETVDKVEEVFLLITVLHLSCLAS